MSSEPIRPRNGWPHAALAGGSERRLWLRLPIGYARTLRDLAVNWMYQTQPEAALHGRSCYWPRGKLPDGFVAVEPGQATPDLQLHFNPASDTTRDAGTRRMMQPDRFPGFSMSVNSCRPTSRGYIAIVSADPMEAA